MQYVIIPLHTKIKYKGLTMWEHITSPAGRWVYGVVLGLLAALSKWIAKLSRDKKELKDQVGRLEGQIGRVESKLKEQIVRVGEKLDVEVSERRNMELKFDKLDEKIDIKFDKFSETLNQVALNTAVNAAKIDK